MKNKILMKVSQKKIKFDSFGHVLIWCSKCKHSKLEERYFLLCNAFNSKCFAVIPNKENISRK